MDLGVLPGRSQLPVTIDVAKPVESAAEAGRLVALGEDCEIGFAELGRQVFVGAWPRRASL